MEAWNEVTGDRLRQSAAVYLAQHDAGEHPDESEFVFGLMVDIWGRPDEALWLLWLQTVAPLLDLPALAQRCIDSGEPDGSARLWCDAVARMADIERDRDNTLAASA